MSTVRTPLTTTWTNIGTTPCVVQILGQSPIFIALGSSPPASPDADSLLIKLDGGSLPLLDLGSNKVATGQTVYARTPNGPAAVIVAA